MIFNITNVTEDFYLPFPYAVTLSVSNGLSSVVGLFGNMFVLVVIARTKVLHTVTDFLIFSLALADLFVTSLVQPMFTYHINYYMETNETVFGVSLDVTGYMFNLVSIITMLIVTLDRLVAIRFPFKYKNILSKQKITIVICMTWLCSASFGAVFILYSLPPALPWGVCTMVLVATIGAYPYIFHQARKQEKQTLQLTKQGKRLAQNSTTKTTTQDKTNRFRIFADKKSAKTVAIIVGFFGLCWIPILIYTQIQIQYPSNKDSFLPGFFVVYTMSLINSACNPYIYCVRNRRYQSGFKTLFRRKQQSAFTKTTGHENHAVSREN